MLGEWSRPSGVSLCPYSGVRLRSRQNEPRNGNPLAFIGVCFALSACSSKDATEQLTPTAPVEIARDGSVVPADAPNVWAPLAELPQVTPARVVTIPTRPTVPRFSVGGPALHRELAVVSSSQFGFAAVDWRLGTLVWTKPAGIKVAPPAVKGDSFVLIGDCVSPPDIPDGRMLLGCLRVVSAAGTDEAYMALHGATDAMNAFAGSAGPQDVWIVDDTHARWRRGDAAVLVDLVSGKLTPDGNAAPPPVVVEYGKRRWEIAHVDGKVVATERGKRAWSMNREVSAMLGAVWLAGQGPMIRMVNIGGFAGTSEVRILDMDATGSMNGTAAWTPVPGISLLGRAISPVGDAALAVRMDSSIKHDFIAAYAASALLIYVFPLPDVLRPDPVGVAIALDDEGRAEAVVAFYDGDQLVVLPNVSAPPTAPGGTREPLENATP
jgi:hypothetical protein